MTGIYIITNLINGKRYIGQSIDIKRRFWDHRCVSHERNRHLRFALMKYGKENFKYEVLEECKEDELDEREKFYIEKLNPEYNVLEGGQSSRGGMTDEIKAALSESGKRQWENLPEDRKKQIVSNNLVGPRKGHPVSEDTREKLRKANIGKKQSDETIQKRKEAMRIKKENGWSRDGSCTFKKVICIETGQVFESVKAAASAFGIAPTRISSVLKKRQETTAGLHFKYFESVETIPDECKEVGQGMSCCPKCEARESVKR